MRSDLKQPAKEIFSFLFNGFASPLENEWYPGDDVPEPEMGPFLVICSDGYIGRAFVDSKTWWVYVREKHEHHPDNTVIWWRPLPELPSGLTKPALDASPHGAQSDKLSGSRK